MYLLKRLPLLCCLLLLLLHFKNSYAQSNAINIKSGSATLAKKHSIRYNKPAPGFFEGALLGNGAMGVVVTTRPDAVVLYFGHNNVWDIRLAENNKKEIGTFKYVFDKIKNIPATLSNLNEDPWYAQYSKMTGENYSRPYPRPFPCGSVILGFDNRNMRLIGHELDISNGMCKIEFEAPGNRRIFLNLFTDMQKDQLLMQLLDANGVPQPGFFNRIRIIPDPSTPAEFPVCDKKEDLENGSLSFRQILPYSALTGGNTGSSHSKDKAFSLSVKVNTKLIKKTTINWNGNTENMALLEAAPEHQGSFTGIITLSEGLNKETGNADSSRPTPQIFNKVFSANTITWNEYWAKSSVQLTDSFLEETWYRNLYFFNCAAKDGTTCPGLFANWSYNDIGTAWHGDYHMNYNTQQPFWVTFSSNHLEKNLPYVNLIESLLPVSRQWAHDYYELPGAYFPHSAYPVEMTMNPYPVPDWGWEVSETPWAVQGLWWHYLYSGDTAFLRQRAYSPIKAAVEFMVAYMKRPEANNAEKWKDDKYHIFPTIPPELYGLRPGFKYNHDCSVDLTLTRFIFKAFIKATGLLNTGSTEKELLKDVSDILDHFPAYPTAVSEKYGKVLVSVPGEHANVIYNVPNALITVFPGEDYGLHSGKEMSGILENTYRNQQNEGGNDLVFKNIQAARIGLLDLEAFKRQIRYCLLPDGTATDMVMQTKGRYNDNTDYAYMAKMGIWFENFALPAVINECLMQSYNGSIRLFPNWPVKQNASFHQLRAAGGFLVSASMDNGKVKEVSILSEKGNTLQVIIPWKTGATLITPAGKKKISAAMLTLATKEGEIIRLIP